MREVVLRPSNKSKGKKYDAIVDGKTISFGASGYDHFTGGHLDEKRRRNYEKRHKAIGDFNDINTASFWAYRFLWLHSTKKEAIKDIEKKFNVKIKYIKD